MFGTVQDRHEIPTAMLPMTTKNTEVFNKGLKFG
jgi:hypothetical protein